MTTIAVNHTDGANHRRPTNQPKKEDRKRQGARISSIQQFMGLISITGSLIVCGFYRQTYFISSQINNDITMNGPRHSSSEDRSVRCSFVSRLMCRLVLSASNTKYLCLCGISGCIFRLVSVVLICIMMMMGPRERVIFLLGQVGLELPSWWWWVLKRH